MKRPHVRDTALWRAYTGSRYAILFYVLLLTLLVMPLFVMLGIPKALISGAVAGCFLAAVMPNATRRTRTALLVTALIIIAASLASQNARLPVNSGLVMAIFGLAGLAAAAGTLRFMVMAKRVDSETIYAALSTYLLAGIFFGQFYWAIETLWPGSIVGPDPLTEQNSIYFSFVTLATLGYGDFLPRNDIARGTVTFEVIGGQLYLAVMVARLISIFAPNKTPS